MSDQARVLPKGSSKFLVEKFKQSQLQGSDIMSFSAMSGTSSHGPTASSSRTSLLARTSEDVSEGRQLFVVCSVAGTGGCSLACPVVFL